MLLEFILGPGSAPFALAGHPGHVHLGVRIAQVRDLGCSPSELLRGPTRWLQLNSFFLLTCFLLFRRVVQLAYPGPVPRTRLCDG